MCKYCEKGIKFSSSNFCGSAKAQILGDCLNIYGDETKIKWFKRIYQPRFKIFRCPMCGRRLGDD